MEYPSTGRSRETLELLHKLQQNISGYFISSCLNPKVTRRTVGKPYDEGFIPNPFPEQEITFLADVSRYRFVGLQPSTEYEIQVAAHTEAGMGMFTEETFHTAPADTIDCEFKPLSALLIF